MNNTDHIEIGDAPLNASMNSSMDASLDSSLDSSPDPSIDFSALIAALRSAGAHQFDPMRLHYIALLAQRGMAHQGRVKRVLDAKLALALAEFKERFEQAQSAAKETIAQTAPHYPHAADALQRLFIAGDFKGLEGYVTTLKTGEQPASLGALVRQLEQHAPGNTDVRVEENTGSRFELKTIRRFRNTWSKLSADKQVTKALEQPPKNAGPLNSHMLVLRSLALMRELSPDYLNRFMSYADTLLCLDHCEKEKLDTAKSSTAKPRALKKSPVAKAAKK